MTFHSTSLSFIGSHSYVIIKRQDMKTTQEEAANMIVHQVADVKGKEVLVVVDDTDIMCSSVSLMLPMCHSNLDLPRWFRQFEGLQ